MSRDSRGLVDARYRHDEAVQDIAARLGRSADAVSVSLFRIRKALRDFFKGHSLVKEVETAPIEQGGEGVTIVRL